MAIVINTSLQEFRRFCEQGEFDEATSLLQTKEISDAIQAGEIGDSLPYTGLADMEILIL